LSNWLLCLNTCKITRGVTATGVAQVHLLDV
jgi:hypothetical protein